MIWAIGLMESWFCIWDNLANPKTRLNLVQTRCSTRTLWRIYNAKQIDIVDYINAFNNLKFSVDKSSVINLSSLTLFFKKDGKTYSVLPGKTIFLPKE